MCYKWQVSENGRKNEEYRWNDEIIPQRMVKAWKINRHSRTKICKIGNYYVKEWV